MPVLTAMKTRVPSTTARMHATTRLNTVRKRLGTTPHASLGPRRYGNLPARAHTNCEGLTYSCQACVLQICSLRGCISGLHAEAPEYYFLSWCNWLIGSFRHFL